MKDIQKRIRALEQRRSHGVEVTAQAREIMALLEQMQHLPKVSFEEHRRIIHDMAVELTAEQRRDNPVMRCDP